MHKLQKETQDFPLVVFLVDSRVPFLLFLKLCLRMKCFTSGLVMATVLNPNLLTLKRFRLYNFYATVGTISLQKDSFLTQTYIPNLNLDEKSLKTPSIPWPKLVPNWTLLEFFCPNQGRLQIFKAFTQNSYQIKLLTHILTHFLVKSWVTNNKSETKITR